MLAVAGRVLVQLRFKTGLTSDEYVTRQAWREATLSRCPRHPRGGCGFARHGTYARVSPPGTRIARWYCPQAHCTFSLLPDHLAARFPGTLQDLEEVVAHDEQAKSREAAANALREDDITLPSALRWLRRRVALVHTLLVILVGLLPELFLGCTPTVAAVRAHLGGTAVLVRLRDLAHLHLPVLPRPLGFRPPHRAHGERSEAGQQRRGPDPPAKTP